MDSSEIFSSSVFNPAFRPIQTPVTWKPGVLFSGYSGRGVKLITHHPLPKLRICGTTTALPHVSSWRADGWTFMIKTSRTPLQIQCQRLKKTVCVPSVPTFSIYYTTLQNHNFVLMHILSHFPTLPNTSNSAHEWHLVPWCLITLSGPRQMQSPPPLPLHSPLSLPARQAFFLLLLFSICAIHWCCWSCDWSPWRNLEKYIPAVYSNWNTDWVSGVLNPAIIRRFNP